MNNKSLIVEPLGLFGWNKIEPVILASLASEMPILLVGKHGCAKSFIFERLAESLKLNYRSYNASLINYDDLVGIPVPTNNNTSLEYISTPNSIWDANVVFIDEINRTKPELQNKLFPIIYEKRVQGVSLTNLKYRWAAMNPPSLDEDEDELSYLGTSPLDPALADRFPFIIEVPSWDELSEKDKENILNDQFTGKHEMPVDIHQIIKETQEEYQKLLLTIKPSVSKYILAVAELLKNTLGYISPRRVTMMQESLLMLHASRMVIGRYLDAKEDVSLADTASLHIQVCIPNLANRHIDKAILIAVADSAFKIIGLSSSIEKDILLMNDPIEKIKYIIKNKDDVTDEILNETLISTISLLTPHKRRCLSLLIYLIFRKRKNLNASLMETLSLEIKPVFRCQKNKSMEPLVKKRIANKIVAILGTADINKKSYVFLNNLLYSFYPDGYTNEDEVVSLANLFINLWKELIDERAI